MGRRFRQCADRCQGPASGQGACWTWPIATTSGSPGITRNLLGRVQHDLSCNDSPRGGAFRTRRSETTCAESGRRGTRCFGPSSSPQACSPASSGKPERTVGRRCRPAPDTSSQDSWSSATCMNPATPYSRAAVEPHQRRWATPRLLSWDGQGPHVPTWRGSFLRGRLSSTAYLGGRHRVPPAAPRRAHRDRRPGRLSHPQRRAGAGCRREWAPRPATAAGRKEPRPPVTRHEPSPCCGLAPVRRVRCAAGRPPSTGLAGPGAGCATPRPAAWNGEPSFAGRPMCSGPSSGSPSATRTGRRSALVRSTPWAAGPANLTPPADPARAHRRRASRRGIEADDPVGHGRWATRLSLHTVDRDRDDQSAGGSAAWTAAGRQAVGRVGRLYVQQSPGSAQPRCCTGRRCGNSLATAVRAGRPCCDVHNRRESDSNKPGANRYIARGSLRENTPLVV